MEPSDPNSIEFTPELKARMRLEVEAIAGHREEALYASKICLKNDNSYLITYGLGQRIKLIERGVEIYKDQFWQRNREYHKIFYSNSMGCYFLVSKCKIYKKRIDSRPPVVHMVFEKEKRERWTTFRHYYFSEPNNRLMVKRPFGAYCFINLKTKKFEINFGRFCDEKFAARLLVNPYEDRLLLVTKKCKLMLYSLFHSRCR